MGMTDVCLGTTTVTTVVPNRLYFVPKQGVVNQKGYGERIAVVLF